MDVTALDALSVDGDLSDTILRDAPNPVDAIEPPSGLRQLSPLSSSTVSSRRPTLAWTLPPGSTLAQVQLCRDRACLNTIAMVEGATRARPAQELPSGWVFWRVRSGRSVTPTWQFWVSSRSAAGDRDATYGQSLDVNGDGFCDLAVGARRDTRNGKAYVYFGSRRGLSTAPDQTLNGMLTIPNNSEEYATTISNAGDVNGDGYSDLLVGAPGALPTGLNDVGATYLYLGSPTGLQQPAARVYLGTMVGERDGSSLAALGDINNDGYGDFAVGAVRAGAVLNAGRAAIFLGAPTAALPMSPAQTLIGEMSNDKLGGAISGLGDINGDGITEVAIASPEATRATGASAGLVRIYSASGPNGTLVPGATFSGSTASEYFGFSLAGGGDLNGDGYADLVVGAPGAQFAAGTSVGSATVYFGGPMGLTAAGMGRFFGTTAAGNFGFALTIAGDINGDGLSDLAVNARTATANGVPTAGQVHVYHGQPTTAPSPTLTLSGTQSNSDHGRALTILGDVNGDLIDDLAIGVPFFTVNGAALTGKVQLHLGTAAGIVANPSLTLAAPVSAGAFGACFAE